MKKIIVFAIAIVAVCAAVIIPACQSGKASTGKMLKLNLEKGKGYDYEIIWDLETAVMEQKTKVSVAGLYSMVVTNEEAGVKSISTEYKSMRMDMEAMGMKMNIDSNNPDTGNAGDDNPMQKMMGKMFSGVIGKPFIINVDEEGNVVEIKGFDGLFNSMVDSLAIDEDKKAEVRASMKGQFNDDELKKQFAPVFTIFPNKEVKVGDSWEKSYSVGGQMPSKFVTTYTVKQIEGDHVTMTAKTKISGDESRLMQLSGKQDGNIIVDSKTGLMVNADFKQVIEVSVSGTKIEVTGKGKIKGTAQ